MFRELLQLEHPFLNRVTEPCRRVECGCDVEREAGRREKEEAAVTSVPVRWTAVGLCRDDTNSHAFGRVDTQLAFSSVDACITWRGPPLLLRMLFLNEMQRRCMSHGVLSCGFRRQRRSHDGLRYDICHQHMMLTGSWRFWESGFFSIIHQWMTHNPRPLLFSVLKETYK